MLVSVGELMVLVVLVLASGSLTECDKSQIIIFLQFIEVAL